jgi:uncharacterized membrane protein YccC
MIAQSISKPWPGAWYPAWGPPLTRQSILFSIRAWIASLVALYIAFVLQLESPVWAWLTCFIVAQPTPGMTLSKGLYRFIGTVGGAFLGVILIALFAQTPELFVLALALLVGGLTLASNLLTNNRAYATVLAAYTAGIVASDAIDTPDQVFLIAMARAAAILVGASCGILASSLFAPHRAEADTRARLADLLKAVSHRAVIPWQAPTEERVKIGKRLVDDAIALNTLVEFAAAESAVFRLQANNARSLIAHVFGVISARRSLDAHLRRCGWPRHDALQIFHGVVVDLLNDLPQKLERGNVHEMIAQIEEVRGQLADLHPEDDAGLPADLVSVRLVIDRIDDLLEHLGCALLNWRDILEERWERMPTRQLNFHRDARAAWINGARAFIAVCITGAFWIGTAWPHGPDALVFVAVLLSLFSALPRPDVIAWYFFLASLPGVVVGPVFKFYVLAANSGFDYFVIVSSIILLPLGLYISNPLTAPLALAFAFVCLNLAGPANPMIFNLSDTLNTAIATEFGVLAGVAAFVLIFPPDPHGARKYVTYRIRLGLGMLAASDPITPFSEWETRMYDRVNRLHDPNNPSGTNTDEWFEAGLGALTLGNEILRLRHRIAEDPMSPDVKASLQPVVARIARIVRQPEPAFAALQGASDRVAGMDPGRGDPHRITWARVTGTLEEMVVYLNEHPRLLNRAPVP